jgi:hypothetical protein
MSLYDTKWRTGKWQRDEVWRAGGGCCPQIPAHSYRSCLRLNGWVGYSVFRRRRTTNRCTASRRNNNTHFNPVAVSYSVAQNRSRKSLWSGPVKCTIGLATDVLYKRRERVRMQDAAQRPCVSPWHNKWFVHNDVIPPGKSQHHIFYRLFTISITILISWIT